MSFKFPVFTATHLTQVRLIQQLTFIQQDQYVQTDEILKGPHVFGFNLVCYGDNQPYGFRVLSLVKCLIYDIYDLSNF